MKKKILFGLLCLMSMTTLVNAQDNNENIAPWNSIMKNGFVHLKGTKPAEGLTQDQFKLQVQQYMNEQYQEQIKAASTRHQGEDHIIATSCYNSYCNFEYISCEFEGECDRVAVSAPLIWDDEPYSEDFQKIAPNGIFTMGNAIKPNIEDAIWYYSSNYIPKVLGNSFYGQLSNCNDDYSECVLSLREDHYTDTGETIWGIEENHIVKVVWQEPDSQIKSVIDEVIQKVESSQERQFVVTDLNLVNYLAHRKDDSGSQSSINYANNLNEILKNGNITYYLDARRGDTAPIFSFAAGLLSLCYDGIFYGSVDGENSVSHQYIIYIPEETENTSEAYILAAKKRIDSYLGNTGTKIAVGGKISELEIDEESLSKFDVSKIGDVYYLVTIDDIEYPFLIMKDSSKIETPVVEKTDIKTNVSVKTESTELPLDTILKVEEVTKETEIFKNTIQSILNIKEEEEVQIYDFTLFSETLNKAITKLETGEFKVMVPVKESLRGKKLAAYYITEDNKVEIHPITEKDGMATFTTTHFSVYTIAEERTIDSSSLVEVPKTYDGIMNSVILGVVGLAGLAITTIVLKKREN